MISLQFESVIEMPSDAISYFSFSFVSISAMLSLDIVFVIIRLTPRYCAVTSAVIGSVKERIFSALNGMLIISEGIMRAIRFVASTVFPDFTDTIEFW